MNKDIVIKDDLGPAFDSFVGNLGAGTLSEHMQIRYRYVSKDKMIAEMPVGPRNIQPYRRLHGGASAALAEDVASVGSFLAISGEPGKAVVGVDLNCTHVRPAPEGSTVYAVAKLIHKGTSNLVWNVEIRLKVKDDWDDQVSNKLVCISRITCAVIPIHKGPPQGRNATRNDGGDRGITNNEIVSTLNKINSKL